MTQTNVRNWRVINIVIFGTALVTPWLRFELDAYSTPVPSMPGWSFILDVWRGIWIGLVDEGLNLNMWPFWLLGFSFILVIVYIILNIYLVVKDVRSRKNKSLSFILLAVAGVFLFPVLIGAHVMWGYWLINLVLLSGVILEWMEVDSADK